MARKLTSDMSTAIGKKTLAAKILAYKFQLDDICLKVVLHNYTS